MIERRWLIFGGTGTLVEQRSEGRQYVQNSLEECCGEFVRIYGLVIVSYLYSSLLLFHHPTCYVSSIHRVPSRLPTQSSHHIKQSGFSGRLAQHDHDLRSPANIDGTFPRLIPSLPPSISWLNSRNHPPEVLNRSYNSS